MKKVFTLASICLFTFVSQAETTAQETVELFFSTHSVESSTVYCRTDIPTTECRTLIRFKNNATSELVDSFQISFFAPSRQSVGTELFLKGTKERPGHMQQYIDKSFDGKFVAEQGESLPIAVTSEQIVISEWKPAPNIVAELKFDKSRANINGTITKPDGSTSVLNLNYDLFSSPHR